MFESVHYLSVADVCNSFAYNALAVQRNTILCWAKTDACFVGEIFK